MTELITRTVPPCVRCHSEHAFTAYVVTVYSPDTAATPDRPVLWVLEYACGERAKTAAREARGKGYHVCRTAR